MLRDLWSFWWQSNLLIIFVLIMSKARFVHLRARVKYALWLIPLIRILLPFRFIPGPMTTYATPDSMGRAYEEANYTLATGTISPRLILLVIYFVISGVMIGFGLYSNLEKIHKLRSGSYPLHGNIYVSRHCQSAVSLGLGRAARIYVSHTLSEECSPEEIEMILTHEQGHIHNGDFIWNIVRGLLIAFCWYNPLIWLAVYQSKVDAELAADEYAMTLIGSEHNKAYANLLVQSQRQPSLLKFLPQLTLQTEFSSNYQDLKHRIQALYHGEKIRKLPRSIRQITTIATVMVVCVVLVIAFMYPRVSYADTWTAELTEAEVHATSVYEPRPTVTHKGDEVPNTEASEWFGEWGSPSPSLETGTRVTDEFGEVYISESVAEDWEVMEELEIETIAEP